MSVLEQVTGFLNLAVWNNTIQDYLLAGVTFLVLCLGLSVVRRVAVHYLGRLAARTVSDFDDFCVQLLRQIGWPVIAVLALHIAASSLVLAASVRMMVHYAVVFVLTVRAILIIQSILQYCVAKFIARQAHTPYASAAPVIESTTWLLKWSLWVLGAVFVLSNLGINVSSLVAGIGIGGIAVAMASQAVLGDAFSAMCIYLDRPFEIGDFIIIDDKLGSVEHIGLKTTRIRSLSGEQLIFANSDLTKSRIQNYKRMQTRRIVFTLNILLHTPVEKVERVPGMIKDILGQQDVNIERVHFLKVGDFALVYEIAYHVKSADYNVYMDTQQAINLAIMRAFAAEDIHFAYPTQTVYLTRSQPSHDHAAPAFPRFPV